MSKSIRKAHRFARLGVVLSVVFMFSAFGMALSNAAQPFTATLNIDDTSELSVTVSGTANSPSNATHHMVIEWGDGNSDILPNFDTDAPWNWGPVSHDYAAAGDYTITATLIHANDQGNDRSAASDSSDVSVPGPCTENCSTDDGTTDDGSTDDGSTDDGTVDGSTDDGSTDGTEVQGNTVKPVVKPAKVKPAKLAKTGPETTVLALFGLSLLMLGVSLRFGGFGTPVAAAAAAQDVLVARTLALVERTVNRNARRDCR